MDKNMTRQQALSRREMLAALGGGAAGAALASTSSIVGAAPEPPAPVNLLFIMTDQQRWDALSRAGNTVLETPNLDRLAGEGAYFENAFTNCPICVPARAVMLTGLTIETVNVTGNGDYDSPYVLDAPTFDSVLADAGCHTEYYGKWHTPYQFAANYENYVRQTGKYTPEGGTSQKAAYIEWLDQFVANRDPVPGELIDKGSNHPYLMDPADWNYGKLPGEVTTYSQAGEYGKLDIPHEFSRMAFTVEETLEALARLKDTTPFSLTCSMGPPHPPMVSPTPYYGMYPSAECPLPASFDEDMTGSPYQARAADPEMMHYRDETVVRYATSDYYALVKEVDDHVGVLLDRLEEYGLANNTLVVFTSDHGEMLGAHAMHSKMVLYEESAHIPLILRLPGAIAAGTVVSAPVSHVDLFATILDYLGHDAPDSEGRSLRALIESGDDGGLDFCVSEWSSNSMPRFMTRTRDWKFLFGGSPTASSLDALYNLRNDPHEMENLLAGPEGGRPYAVQAHEMRDRLIAWLEAVESPHLQGVIDRAMPNPPTAVRPGHWLRY
jgi:arylsulfatase A-like enzyme